MSCDQIGELLMALVLITVSYLLYFSSLFFSLNHALLRANQSVGETVS